MKQGKNPTRKQKKIIGQHRNLKTENWLVILETLDELHIMHRYTGNVRVLNKRI